MKKRLHQRKSKLLTLVALLFCTVTHLFAQKDTDIEIGDKVPDISFTHLVNHTSKTAKLSDFAGKLVIIDFWNTGCGPCIQAFPKMDSLQKKFGDKIQIIAVASESETVIADFVTRMGKTRNINFSFPFEAANLQLRSVFKHIYVPHEVWIGPDGIVKATTERVTAEDIVNVLNGNASALAMKTDRETRKVDWSRPFEIKRLGEVLYENDRTNQDTALRYISVFTKYIDNIEGSAHFPAFEPRARVQNGSISGLYSMAYGLQTKKRTVPFNRIRLENIDKELYVPPVDYPEAVKWMKKNYYCYEINFPSYYAVFPKDVTGNIRDVVAKEMGEIMQKDLARFFGFQAGFEKRKEKCLVLYVTDGTKLVTRGGKPSIKIAPGFLGMSVTNTPMDKISGELAYYLRLRIMLDETGFTGNMDLELNTKLVDWVAVSKELAPFGLGIKEEEREVDVLVIRGKN